MKSKNWEKEFDDRYDHIREFYSEIHYKNGSITLKDFIRKTLASQRKQVIEEIQEQAKDCKRKSCADGKSMWEAFIGFLEKFYQRK